MTLKLRSIGQWLQMQKYMQGYIYVVFTHTAQLNASVECLQHIWAAGLAESLDS